MSLTSNNDQSQEGGAGDIDSANGAGAGNQGQPNQIEATQDPVGGTPTVGGGPPTVGGAGTGTNTVGGGGTGTILQVVAPGAQLPVLGLPQANPNQLILWNGNWPGAKGKIATYMAENAGTPAAQKETAEKVFDFIKNPNSHLGTIATDTQPIAYLIHVAGTTNIRVVYGLSPIVANPFQPEKPKLFRSLIRDLKSLGFSGWKGFATMGESPYTTRMLVVPAT